MDFFIIILFIIIILTVMIMSYIPYDLQVTANKAGFGRFSLRYLILKIQKVPLKHLFEQFELLEESNVKVEFDELKNFWQNKPNEFNKLIDILINAEKFGINVNIDDFEHYNLTEKNSERFYKLINKLSDDKKNLKREKIIKLINSDINIDLYIDILEKSKSLDFKISDEEIENNEPELLENYISAYSKFKSSRLKLSNHFFDEKTISVKKRTEYLNSLLYIQNTKTDLTGDELFELLKLGINTYDFIKSIELINLNKHSKFTKDIIKQHYLKGGNSFKVVHSYLNAKKNEVDLDPDLLFMLDLRENSNFSEIIEKCIYIQDLKVKPEIKKIIKDGIQISPKIIVSVREKIESIETESKKEILFRKINNFIDEDLSDYDSHKDIIREITSIENKLIKQLSEDKILKDIYSILKVKIEDINIVADTLASIKEIEAKEKDSEAKSKLIESKTKFQEDMAEAVKKGNLSFKDYQKEKYIFDASDDNDLPYPTDK